MKRKYQSITFYLDDDVNKDEEAMRQLMVLDKPTTVWDMLPGANDLNSEGHWLKDKSEDFYNGMHAGVKAAIFLLREHCADVEANAVPYLLGLRFDILRVLHKKLFK